ncbi:MAG: hypothetical protein AABN33_03665 [Acidobacteriota bacterium]
MCESTTTFLPKTRATRSGSQRSEKKGWTVLTKDSHIKHRLVERTALLEAGVRAFVLVSGNLTGPEMAKIFVRALPRMKKFAARHLPPFIAKIHRDGSIEAWVSQ